jgi:NADH-quinone oxidoreductase subunit H
VIPADFGKVFADINVGLLYLFAVSSMAVYGIILAGWSSNSKYALLGSMRSAAQMISYEVSMGLIMVSILLCTGSLNLTKIVECQKNVWFFIPMFPMWVIFFISSLAECNRAPFDLPEAEAELVGGYHVEYSSLSFSMFFLGEYANMILMSAMNAILFFGGWLPPMERKLFCWIPNPMWFILKICLFLFLFIWVRATLPRYRYDQLMKLGWKIFLPITLAWVVITAIFVKFIL